VYGTQPPSQVAAIDLTLLSIVTTDTERYP